MDKKLKADLYRYEGLIGFKGFLKGLRIPGFRYMFFLRMAARSKRHSLSWFFFTRLLSRYSFKYGFQIPIKTEIGGGFYIGHFGPIVINEKAKVGKNCNIAHNTTIGQTNRGAREGCPTIGDNVWIGTGAVIVGRIKISSNVLIAPNSFVNVDVPENSIVLGNPCKIISKNNPCEGYIGSTLEF
ncbi:serine O-acetyltransferase [Sphingobacterium hungaricum]|uniref:Serine acetyltransferase n=1 Tax=Sphingobacterium hungaricum TaxID=2082723 RepID=A0A928UX31_9SPHI|nr:serine acetyltransferase [Sphingobacterium hungaricum]MBE8712352.1 serine acetyltransferase [Sphingobacterium hungaricum]